jgi:heat shock protein HslJ
MGACGPASIDGSSPDNLKGELWRLEGRSLSSLVQPVAPGANITIAFKNDHVSGHSACNAYSASYHASNDGSISFGRVSVTAMACAQPIMVLEDAYLKALGQVTRFSVEGTLVLKGSGIALAYSRGTAASPMSASRTTSQPQARTAPAVP